MFVVGGDGGDISETAIAYVFLQDPRPPAANCCSDCATAPCAAQLVHTPYHQWEGRNE
jgi:hypothetical protein